MSPPTDAVKRWGLLLGPLLALVTWAALPGPDLRMADDAVALVPAGRRCAAVAALMAVWWLTEAVPIPVTALVPVALFPVLGIANAAQASAPYGHSMVFLFLGGFLLGLAMERSNLHRRFALRIMAAVGLSPPRLIAGFMLAAAFLSMWISNTATVVMMLPIGWSVADLAGGGTRSGPGETSRLPVALLLGIAYGSSIGGVGTLIGTPPNALLAAFASDRLGLTLGFRDWLCIGLPVMFLFLPITWYLLAHVLFPEPEAAATSVPAARSGAAAGAAASSGAAAGPGVAVQEKVGARIAAEIAALGSMDSRQRRVLGLFLLTGALWILRPWIQKAMPHLLPGTDLAGLDDSSIAIAAGILLFLVPAGDGGPPGLLTWEDARQIPWGVLILFGGGLSLAGALERNGVAAYLGTRFQGLEGLPQPVVMLLVSTMVIFLTELTSNTATTATLLPVLAAVARQLQIPPLMLLVPATVSASFAFMLPVATPPNALVFATGKVRIRDMCLAGLWLNILGALLVPALVYLFLPSLR